MTNTMFDVQAAMLYARPQEFDFAELTTAIHKRAAMTGVRCELELLEGLTGKHILALGGGGVHVTISLRSDPCDARAFSLALQSPIRKMKSFDFEGTIASHTAAIVINIGDGDTPMPLDARKMMAEMAGMNGADPIEKLMMLQLVMQTIIEETPPLMIDFCPSQTLLSPVEYEAVADLALPVPILFHPLIEVGGTSAQDKPLLRMTALHSQFLTEQVLVLDGAPSDMNPGLMINILSTLIIENRAGNLTFDHDTVIDLGEGLAVQFLEEAPNPGEPPRVIARLVDPDGPFETHPRPETNVPPIDQTAEVLEAAMDSLMREKAERAGDLASRPAETQPRLRSGGSVRFALPVTMLVVGGFVLLSGGIADQISARFSSEIAAIDQPDEVSNSALPQVGRPAPAPVTAIAAQPENITETNGLFSKIIKAPDN